MSEVLQSPFTIGVCVVVVLAWILMLAAIFWPRRGARKSERDEDRLNGYF